MNTREIQAYRQKIAKKIAVFTVGIILISYIGVGINYLWDDYKYTHSIEYVTRETSRKLIDISNSLYLQRHSILKEKESLLIKIRFHKLEIQEEIQGNNVVSLNSASDTVKRNILFLQKEDAYYWKLSEMEKVIQNAEKGIDFMCSQNRMRKIVGDGLSVSNSIEEVLEKYGSDKQIFTVNPKELKLKSPEVIWQQYVK